MPKQQDGQATLGDPVWPTQLDRPQRFGTRAYARADPGQTTLRLDFLGMGIGASTANQWWGPMATFPYVLSNNAAGFPFIFLGTSSPTSVLIGRVHVRVVYGRLEQSPYYPKTLGRYRFASGTVAVFEPRGLPGLELGVTRFFSAPWPVGALTNDYFTHLFEVFLKSRISKTFRADPTAPNQSIDNQLASVFARWLLPRSGLEVYAEYGREDHSWNLRDFLVEPDHSRTFGMGMRKAWQQSADRLTGIGVELMNFDLPTLARHRAEGLIYLHAYTPGGHTNLGQLMGSSFGVGTSSAAQLSWDRFSRGSSSHVRYSRTVAMTDTLGGQDVRYAIEAKQVRLWRPRLQISGGLALVQELDRYFARDAANWQVTLGLTWLPGLGRVDRGR